jgi:two-component system cell cycle sensor histidine kinase/response regulator CckA
VLSFARGADGNRLLLQPSHVLAEIAKIAGETFSKAIRLRTSWPENLWLIEGDLTQLHQVILNLCVNARDSMPEGGNLTLTAENLDVDQQYAAMAPGLKPGPYVLINVIDTGSGIPPHLIDKVFSPFFTTKEQDKGTGLGLSTALGIVNSHGGLMNVSSGTHGTTLRVLLPAAPSALPLAKLEPHSEIPAGHGETILLVDDESAIREVGKAVLSQNGYKVLTADGGPSALAIFAQQSKKIAAVVTDSEMPLMSGLILARTLRKMDNRTKIVLSTARNSEFSRTELSEIGAQACLNKPYTRETLLCTIGRVLTAKS